MFIGIDIGGTKINATLFRNKKIVGQIIIKTPHNKKEFVKTLKIILKKFIKFLPKNSRRINGISIGCAGVISGTKVILSPNIRYLKNFDFRLIFPRHLKLNLDNDARYFLKKCLRTTINNKIKKILAFTIGTGIGRAYGENGKIRKIKKFEYPEIWEKKYQKIRDAADNNQLAKFLAGKLSPIVQKYKPDLIILTGGVIQRKNFFRKIQKEFIKNGINPALSFIKKIKC